MKLLVIACESDGLAPMYNYSNCQVSAMLDHGAGYEQRESLTSLVLWPTVGRAKLDPLG